MNSKAAMAAARKSASKPEVGGAAAAETGGGKNAKNVFRFLLSGSNEKGCYFKTFEYRPELKDYVSNYGVF